MNRQESTLRRLLLMCGLGVAAGAACPALGQWEKSWDDGVASHTEFRAIERVVSGVVANAEYVVAGGASPNGTPGTVELAYWDAGGNPVPGTRRIFTHGTPGGTLEIVSVRELANGDILAVGSSATPTFWGWSLVMRLGANLNVLWATGSSYNVNGVADAIELSNGTIMVVDEIWSQDPGYAGVQSRLAYYTAAGAHISSRALRTTDGRRVIVRDLAFMDDERVYGAGTLLDPLTGMDTACVVRFDPSVVAGSQFTGLWEYHDLDSADSHFHAIQLVDFNHEILVAGTSVNTSNAALQTRVVRIDDLVTMDPAHDFRFDVDLEPAAGGLRATGTTMCGLGASTDHAYVVGSTRGGTMAGMMMLNAWGSPTAQHLAEFGPGPAQPTSFLGLTLTSAPTQLPVLVGSRLKNQLPGAEDQGYMVQTDCNWTTPCATVTYPVDEEVDTLKQAVGRLLGPVQMATGAFAMVEFHMAVPIVTTTRTYQGLDVTVCGLCKWDMTTGAVPGQPGYGTPNGVLNNDDFFYFVAQFAAGNVAVADLTTGAIPGSPGYGVPNGVINNDDFFYYLTGFSGGC